MKVLGFSGKAQHGKDTCALIARTIAREELGMSMGSWALAHPLKALVYGEAAGEFTFEDVFNIKPPVVRRKLQQRGTEQGRILFGESLWTLQTEAYIRLFGEFFPIDGIVLTDVRFPNEVDFVRAAGVEVSVACRKVFDAYLDTQGFDPDSLDPEEPQVMVTLLNAEQEGIKRAQAYREELTADPNGMALYIQSDRPTLTGEAAQHPSETSLDELDKGEEFDGVIDNHVGVTLDDLAEQIRPYVMRLFKL